MDRPIKDLLSAPYNPRRISAEALSRLKASLKRFGCVQPIVVNRRSGHVVGGHQRLKAMQNLGMTTAPVVEVDLDDLEEKALNVTLNNQALAGEFTEDLQPLLESLKGLDYFEDVGLDQLLEEIAPEQTPPQGRPAPSVDKIFCASDDPLQHLIAQGAGWMVGVRSSDYRGKTKVKFEFVDNDFHAYDHAKHLATVQEIRPKYATAMDAMTKAQAKRAGAKWMSLDEILATAEELEKYAANVIIIPKYDCLAEIPERFMLGFSVSSSYGGTPLNFEIFRGRRIHLLGGSWQGQKKFFCPDVVSFDNNSMAKLARSGVNSIVRVDYGCRNKTKGIYAATLAVNFCQINDDLITMGIEKGQDDDNADREAGINAAEESRDIRD